MSGVPVAVRIDEDIRERVQRLAEQRQRSPHWLFCEAIRQYVEREEKREAFRREALNAWREYQDTGLHADADEVLAWLATWGEEHEVNAPACHK